jgi:hypothetical protein
MASSIVLFGPCYNALWIKLAFVYWMAFEYHPAIPWEKKISTSIIYKQPSGKMSILKW